MTREEMLRMVLALKQECNKYESCETCVMNDIRRGRGCCPVPFASEYAIWELEKLLGVGKKTRGFEAVKDAPADTILPKRGTKNSAGYDFYASEDIVCRPHSVSKLSFTNIKAKMPKDEYLAIMIRSSLAVKHGLQVAQGTAVIDSDYYGNPDNDGNIGIAIVNNSNIEYIIRKGERFAQGIFQKYFVTDDDKADGVRGGGYGSTGL